MTDETQANQPQQSNPIAKAGRNSATSQLRANAQRDLSRASNRLGDVTDDGSPERMRDFAHILNSLRIMAERGVHFDLLAPVLRAMAHNHDVHSGILPELTSFIKMLNHDNGDRTFVFGSVEGQVHSVALMERGLLIGSTDAAEMTPSADATQVVPEAVIQQQVQAAQAQPVPVSQVFPTQPAAQQPAQQPVQHQVHSHGPAQQVLRQPVVPQNAPVQQHQPQVGQQPMQHPQAPQPVWEQQPAPQQSQTGGVSNWIPTGQQPVSQVFPTQPAAQQPAQQPVQQTGERPVRPQQRRVVQPQAAPQQQAATPTVVDVQQPVAAPTNEVPMYKTPKGVYYRKHPATGGWQMYNRKCVWENVKMTQKLWANLTQDGVSKIDD